MWSRAGTEPWQSALCVAAAGAVSAVATTSPDVANTRVMLALAGLEMAVRRSTMFDLTTVYAEKGVKGLFAGVVPMIMWIAIEGAVFFGTYSAAQQALVSHSIVIYSKIGVIGSLGYQYVLVKRSQTIICYPVGTTNVRIVRI
jgi:hypothetical protein